MDFKEILRQDQEDQFLDFINEHKSITSSEVPISLIRLCFFSGYLSCIDSVEKIMRGEYNELQ